MLIKLVPLLLVLFSITGCASASYHAGQVDSSTNNLTVGKVQKEISIGMTDAAVIEVLGSPNVVTTDEKRREVWVYDKMSRMTATSSSSGGVFLILGSVAGQSGARSSSQRTLTVIIKYDEKKLVRDIAYHYSSF